MKKFIKYGVVPVVVGTFLLLATVMLLPVLVNVQKFLPQIETQVTQATGRPFSVGADFGVTFFPRLSVTFSDMRLGNPEGIVADDFIQIGSFEAQAKLLPLLTGRFEFSRFVVSDLNIHLQREPDGNNNWSVFSNKKEAGSRGFVSSRMSRLFSRDLFFELIAITDGSLGWNDKLHGSEHRIDDLMLLANNVSPAGSATVDIKATVDGHEMSGAGSIGPFSSTPASAAVDLRLQLDEQFQTIVVGTCSAPVTGALCDLDVNIPSFPLADLCSELAAQKDDNQNAGSVEGQSIELSGHFLGDHKKYSINKGSGTIDGHSFTYELQHDATQQQINKVELTFNSVDLDRYFGGEKSHGDADDAAACGVLETFNKTLVTGKIRGKKVVLADVHFGDVSMDVSGGKGKLNMSNGEFSLNGGKGSFTAIAELSELPVSLESRIRMDRVQGESFFNEWMGFPLVRGLMKADLTLKRSGLPGSELGKAFVGHGTIEFDEGSIAGIELLGADNVIDEKKTEFTRLSADLVMEGGVVSMQPLVLVGTEGTAEMSAEVEVQDKTFKVVSDRDAVQNEVLSLSGSYGADGLAVAGFTDVYEAKAEMTEDVQPQMVEKMVEPGDDELEDITGTPHIDPAIAAQNANLKAEQISRDNNKKTHTAKEGRVRIHPLQELDSSAAFFE